MTTIQHDTIQPGDHVLVLDAFGESLPRRAISGVTMGHDFPVVWVCREDEWEEARAEGRDPDAVPWPADAVQIAEV